MWAVVVYKLGLLESLRPGLRVVNTIDGEVELNLVIYAFSASIRLWMEGGCH